MSKTKRTDTKGIKKSTEKSETSKSSNENRSKETNGNSGDKSKKSETSKSASQTSISHFSSVSTPEYRSGWNKIFGKSEIVKSSSKPKSNYDRHKDLVAKNWNKYQETKDVEHLATICREMPFFDHTEVGQEIARLLKK